MVRVHGPTAQGQIFVHGGLLKGRVPLDVLAHVALNESQGDRNALSGLFFGPVQPDSAEQEKNAEQTAGGQDIRTRRTDGGGGGRGEEGLGQQTAHPGQQTGQAVGPEDGRPLDEDGPGGLTRSQGQPGKARAEPAARPLQQIPEQGGGQTASPDGQGPQPGREEGEQAAPQAHVHTEQHGAGHGQGPGEAAVIVHGHAYPVQSGRRADEPRPPPASEGMGVRQGDGV